MASGQLNSKDLVKGYLRRISSLNPLLNSVIETNPNAVSIAQHLDNERRRGSVRGPLHGIPVLVKDNIATDDNMQTTAGSLALLRQPCASRCGDYSTVARSWRSDSWQSEPRRMGKLPRTMTLPIL